MLLLATRLTSRNNNGTLRTSGQPAHKLPTRLVHQHLRAKDVDNMAQPPSPANMGPCWPAKERWVCVPGNIPTM